MTEVLGKKMLENLYEIEKDFCDKKSLSNKNNREGNFQKPKLIIRETDLKIPFEAGNFQVLIATGQLIGEGTNFPNLDCLFLVYPFSFSGKLTQYIGRLQRGSNENNIIYDYRDSNVDYLEKLFKKRKSYYTKNFDL